MSQHPALQSYSTAAAPAPIGPYSQAVAVGPFVFASGQTGVDPATGQLVGPDVADQAERTISNIEAVLAAAGLTLSDVVKTTVFLQDMADFATVNAVYAKRFTGPTLPARSTVEVAGLPLGAKVEIETIARRTCC
ncbi:MAG: RidA family protein [Micrococcales bacterium]|nr:RidA family protein [Micrococcales bacterium]